ncbi:efflux RND transporter periplasmic adaptor subunit [Kangiella sp. TOML190]|uniref:efflux RND transporter periplasmic adaptor subunit n=1 Tax=Kangiella sp. TOML190 TaxID=2931351 RepID=UPI00203E6629|nr:efflux RND transporter periplasmic adaptor subunit [Kangiella sp. TOML190]
MTKRILIGLLILGITVAVIAVGIATKKQPPQRVQVPPAPLVETVFASVESQQFLVDSQGPVTPKLSSNIVAEVSGRISQVSPKFRVGAFVNKGDLLLTIDPANYVANLRSAEAGLAQAKASFHDAKARSDQARKDWAKIGKGEPNDLVLKIPQLEQAKASVQSAEATLLKAQRDLARTKVKAPYDALIKSKQVDLGQYVNTGSSVANLFGTQTAEIRLPLPDRELAFLELPKQGDESSYPNVLLTGIYAGSEHQWYGKLVRTEGVVEENNRLTYLVAEITDPYNLTQQRNIDVPLRFGTFVDAKIEGITQSNLIKLPRLAFINTTQILTISDESKIKLTKVDVVRGEKDFIYINGGIEDGTEVVITPIENPINDMLVKKIGEEDTPETAEKVDSEDASDDKNPSSAKNIAVSQ